ncbi:uncharacterized protein LOC121997363 isoform X2 [Zingiber officinale]|uniref:uncharacterized protein LOC121997363 isoform X2 n=1 Tax=Zingiber officinale TaxID=94328 RepID=UPI001C4A8F29|nr:uncharacterized protein LOC121997363 isoform X2 [Zingiber officinale]XP_042407668.1 uncharacterized protein LOC121997363 isoform X2 [Zingiber officinale]
MEVGQFLEDEKDLLQSEKADDSRKSHAGIEEEMSGKSLNSSPTRMVVEDQISGRSNISSCIDKLQPENASNEGIPSSLELSTIHIVEVGIAQRCSKATNKDEASSKSSVPKSCTISLPDFSILSGEIRLDNFSIRELQEAFRATFGRQTSVKDKLWLKRRIAMGLTNSSHVPDTDFVIKDNKIVLNEEENRKLQPTQAGSGSSLDMHVINASPKKLETSMIGAISDEQVSAKRLKTPSSKDNSKDDYYQIEKFVVKRMRKPTKRYIEELSEHEDMECAVKSYSCSKNLERVYSPSKSSWAIGDVDFPNRIFSARYIPPAGFKFQVPFVLRARRCRPRKDFSVFMKYQSSGLCPTVEASTMTPVQEESGSGSGSRSRELSSVAVQSSIAEEDMKVDNGTFNCEEKTDVEHGKLDDHGNSFPVNANTQPAEPKSSERRKHHRAWTLCEVQKLVDGVAKYGAGRWSEIRRLAFASYSYRTPVDLKDKWRNLLRASLSQCSIEKGERNSRKYTSVPIPTPILSQVRELAELHAQAGLKLGTKKSTDNEGRAGVHEEGSGFL